jgi:hypothetical protein
MISYSLATSKLSILGKISSKYFHFTCANYQDKIIKVKFGELKFSPKILNIRPQNHALKLDELHCGIPWKLIASFLR